MDIIGNHIVFSARDLTDHLACSRLTALELEALRGGTERPAPANAEADVLRGRGQEHEARYLDLLRARGREIVELSRPGPSLAGLLAGEAATVAAMAAGADVIYQGTFFDGRWRGHADFLLRVDEPSARWPWSYEVCETKLARRVKAAAIIQACSYSAHVERIQGSPPGRIHFVGGDLAARSHRLDDFAAYYRRVKAGFEAAAASSSADAYLWPVDHCDVCPWAEVCDARRRAEDHLSLVAGMRRSQARRLTTAGVSTVTALAARTQAGPVPGIQAPVAERLGAQARLQLEEQRTGRPRYELVEPVEEGQGLCLLPPPSDGDIFFDMEGDHFAAEGGLEYLFGVTTIEDGLPRFQAIWAHDKAGEKRALERFVDFVTERQRAYPDLHVYHYAAYEPSALKRLMGAHATREREIDALLRGEVLVNLYTVVRQGVRVSGESYSLKDLEPLYMAKRGGAVTSAASSIVAYEEWLRTRDQAVLDDIAEYNRLDCESTWRLREWLEERRIEAAARTGETLTRPEPRAGQPSEVQAEAEERTAALAARLTAAVSEDAAERTPEEEATWLLAQLLDWHRREARPEWWAYFAHLGMSADELIEDAEAIGGLSYEGEAGQEKGSVLHRYRFPAGQEHKIRAGDTVHDPATGKSAGTVRCLDRAAGILELKRGKSSKAPHPGAVIPSGPRDTTMLRNALARVGEWVAEHGIDSDGPFRAVRDLLLRRPPRTASEPDGTAAALVHPGEAPDAALRRLVLALDDGCLPVQGPPGTGKTTSGAHAIVALVQAGRRVGITAHSHQAIGNLLSAVCAAAEAAGVQVRALQQAAKDGWCESELVERLDNAAIESRVGEGAFHVVAGTPWLFAREGMTGAVDVLVVDEAGQMSLANVVAMGPATGSIVLLGDPQQLAQPSRGTHPPGAGCSALEHLLEDHATVPPERGILLDETYRMHPDVAGFVSEAFYEGRLRSARSCAGQDIGAGPWAGGTGLRWRPVEHWGNKVSSAEEAAEVNTGVHALLGRRWVDEHGRTRSIGLDDILVVAPCNAQVTALKEALPEGARVGTVDKFQGQEAAVVIFSMATSSADDMPRNLEFLFSLNRLNVAISRARALAVLVCSPELLRVRCRTPEQMRLVNALCLLVEHAERRALRPAA